MINKYELYKRLLPHKNLFMGVYRILRDLPTLEDTEVEEQYLNEMDRALFEIVELTK